MRAVNATHVVRARFDEPDTPEPSKCITSQELDRQTALLVADNLARGQTTDVIVIVKGEIVEVLKSKGELWFSLEMLNREFPGWRTVEEASLSDVAGMHRIDSYINTVRRVLCWTDDGEAESVEAIEWVPARAAEAPSAPYNPPVAA